ncbi:polysaccharide biosynthesis protein [Clostridium sporogenes]|uniref:lipopolysaccharide biosynthesis protein n=1 Tax=Clostridium botulinum TaxID=1491 RepID=UPI000717824C|nr:hypothetical protein [Clostridium botulinum]KRU25380.1 polysaccharide biosynthesis protein [Clostridium sporogenes]KRU28614.1 polysaccharide biosynthesis protein [Clostridium sporogenes]KRU32749.1 polysaccharide biosynthesis protein [Clostridium sporogenes]KRU47522.1 polysaccharide biosynthesis protein [Clostridium sporogenes]MBZ1327882.1 hypothetical protein [Clostridium botulinum]
MKISKYLKVILVDFLGLIVGIISGFLIPKVFNIDQYAFYRTYTLYISYVGMFHFGFSDGIYIILGGKSKDDIKKSKIKGYFRSLIKLEIILFLFFLIMSIVLLKGQKEAIYFSLYIIPFHITHFFKLYFRSIGEFDKYSSIQIYINILKFINVFLVVVFKSPNIFILNEIFYTCVIAIILVIKLSRIKVEAERNDINEFCSITKIGFIIMIANTISNMFLTMDRWFLKIFFGANEFAYYSFGTSMLNVFIVVINSIAILFYPYLAKKNNNKEIDKMKRYIIILSTWATSGFYVLKFIVEKFLREYIPSLEIVQILIMTIPFICIINILFTNLYKARKKGGIYLKVASFMLLVSFILNTFSYLFWKQSKYIAWATLLSFIIWCIYSSKDFKDIKLNLKEYVYLALFIFSFPLVNRFKIDSLSSFTIILIILIFNSLILFKDDLIDVYRYIALEVRKKVRKK